MTDEPQAKSTAEALVARNLPTFRLTSDDVLPYTGAGRFSDVIQDSTAGASVQLSVEFDDACIAGQPVPQSYEEYLQVTREQDARDRGRFMGTGDPAPLPPGVLVDDVETWCEGFVTGFGIKSLPRGRWKANYEVTLTPPVIHQGALVEQVWQEQTGPWDVLPFPEHGQQRAVVNLLTGSIRLCP